MTIQASKKEERRAHAFALNVLMLFQLDQTAMLSCAERAATPSADCREALRLAPALALVIRRNLERLGAVPYGGESPLTPSGHRHEPVGCATRFRVS